MGEGATKGRLRGIARRCKRVKGQLSVKIEKLRNYIP